MLENINFTVPAGSVTALVGHSGSGKTTLAGLLPRFYWHYDGSILLDGHELSDYALDNLRGLSRRRPYVAAALTLFDRLMGQALALR